MGDIGLVLSRENRLVIGQRMYQSMVLLQMGSEELESYLNELSMENPLLEALPPKLGTDIRHAPARSGRVRGRSGGDYELPVPDKSMNTLRAELTEQLSFMKLDPQLERALRFLIVNLDDRGYLMPELERSGTWSSAPALFQKALGILQSMEPAGVGARSLSECLCIQLERRGLRDSAAYAICRDYLEHLARSHLNHISKALGIPVTEVGEAKRLITTLNPNPSNGYDDGRCDCWVVPDVEVELDGEGELVLHMLEQHMPDYEVSGYYAAMLRGESLSDEEREYFTQKLSQAQWALDCVKRRRETLLKCVTAVIDEQRDFFLSTAGALRPCTMSDLAYRIGMHPSTVSRAMKNKYLSCKRGVFPLSHFFTGEVSGETSDEIIRCMRELLSGEDPRRPLSDSAICDELSDRGYDIARRTVAKYRDKAGIPPAAGRKRLG